jgi:hypothetical protein
MGSQVFWTELYFARIGISWLFRQALGILLMALVFVIFMCEFVAQGDWQDALLLGGGVFLYFWLGAKVIRWVFRLITYDAAPSYTLDDVLEQDRIVREKSAGHVWFELSDVPLKPAPTGKTAKVTADEPWRVGGPSAFGR